MNRLMVVAVSFLLAGGAYAKGGEKKKGEKLPAADVVQTAAIEAKSGAKLTGKYTFTQKGKEVTLKVEVENAPPGDHAVHIHETPDCSDPDGKKAGGHWNPSADQHGDWHAEHHHLGDVGNMKVGADGKGMIELKTDKWTMDSGDAKTDVLGHAIIVHEKIDDMKTQPTGNAGNRIGCGVIPAPAGTKAATEKPAAAPAK
jgi:Cu-Zn family superoxide dismutase